MDEYEEKFENWLNNIKLDKSDIEKSLTEIKDIMISQLSYREIDEYTPNIHEISVDNIEDILYSFEGCFLKLKKIKLDYKSIVESIDTNKNKNVKSNQIISFLNELVRQSGENEVLKKKVTNKNHTLILEDIEFTNKNNKIVADIILKKLPDYAGYFVGKCKLNINDNNVIYYKNLKATDLELYKKIDVQYLTKK